MTLRGITRLGYPYRSNYPARPYYWRQLYSRQFTPAGAGRKSNVAIAIGYKSWYLIPGSQRITGEPHAWLSNQKINFSNPTNKVLRLILDVCPAADRKADSGSCYSEAILLPGNDKQITVPATADLSRGKVTFLTLLTSIKGDRPAPGQIRKLPIVCQTAACVNAPDRVSPGLKMKMTMTSFQITIIKILPVTGLLAGAARAAPSLPTDTLASNHRGLAQGAVATQTLAHNDMTLAQNNATLAMAHGMSLASGVPLARSRYGKILTPSPMAITLVIPRWMRPALKGSLPWIACVSTTAPRWRRFIPRRAEPETGRRGGPTVCGRGGPRQPL
ncbi:hypothetical protein O0544_13985 [Edwardsiella anguillarum]|nr:hypothetical protein [Edwardsiella anguillarum]